MKALLFIISFCPLLSIGQITIFHADTSRLRSWSGNTQASFDQVMKMQWKIKGQYLTWGNQLSVTPGASGIDTVFFRLSDQREWDTLICKIQPNTNYRFVYNACCDYFDVMDDTGNRTVGKVSFQLSKPVNKKEKYLGTIDENGIRMSLKPVQIIPTNRSPMLPNSYNVAISLINKCHGKDCLEVALHKTTGEKDISYKIKIIKYMISFRYLQLSTEPLIITLNPVNGKVEIK
ncbi:MAG: hypothetical protein ABI761_07855 [Saprospiraceae bacterium]